jgi:hypothetical protein
MTETTVQNELPASIPTLLLAWAKHRLTTRLNAMKPAYTTEQAARAVAASGNPAGF